MFAYDFQTNRIPGDPAGAPIYWRDVGTLDAYFDANMDLRSISPELNFYNRQWPLRTAGYSDAPAKFIFDADGRRGHAIDSIVAGGTILSGGLVRTSVIGRGVRIHSHAYVEDSIIFDNCDIGRRARIRRAILDKNVRVPPDAVIGYDLERDREYGISRHRNRHRGGGRPSFTGRHRQHESVAAGAGDWRRSGDGCRGGVVDEWQDVRIPRSPRPASSRRAPVGVRTTTLPGAQVIENAKMFPGADPFTYAFTETHLQRNLYRIPLTRASNLQPEMGPHFPPPEIGDPHGSRVQILRHPFSFERKFQQQAPNAPPRCDRRSLQSRQPNANRRRNVRASLTSTPSAQSALDARRA